MNKLFNTIKTRKPKGNQFNLSHENKMSMRMGNLTPFLVQEVIPGDNFKINTEVFMRLAPMVSPVMHRINVLTHYFFVPNRIIWNEWEDFITGGPDGTVEPISPRIAFTGGEPESKIGTLADYLGIPTPAAGASGVHGFSALPFRAYLEIYNNYFRDQNLQEEVTYNKGTVPAPGDFEKLTTLRKKAWEKDYFTSCLPWAQRGEEIEMPITGSFEPQYKDVSEIRKSDGTTMGADNLSVGGVSQLDGDTYGPARVENLEDDQNLEGGSFTINALRQAVKLQEWLEKNARGGARYVEQILSHFGVVSSDQRLNRPEMIGGGRTNVVISEVLNTTGTIDLDSEDGQPLPMGTMAGHGIAAGGGHRANYRAEEHGFIIGLISVLPRTAYKDGIERFWDKKSKYDYFWPEFAHLGEQEVLNQEIWHNWASGTSANDDTFGYQSRYAEYKYRQSQVHGDFRESLEFWQMGRKFDSLPVLNESFVMSDPTTRIFAVDDEGEPPEDQIDNLYVQVYHKIKAFRPIPVFGTPKL